MSKNKEAACAELTKVRAWHARRIGWKPCEAFPEVWYRGNDVNDLAGLFPATLDAADVSFPPGVPWQRYNDKWTAYGTRKVYEVSWDETGDKIRDLYTLSKLAWESEGADAGQDSSNHS